MATQTPYWQLEKEYYTIADDADLVLRIIEQTTVTTTENGFPLTVNSPTKIHEFKVHRATLSNGSTFFNQLLNRTPETFAEATSDQNVLDVAENDGALSIRALGLWFKITHDKAGPDTHELGIDGIWQAISVAQKYGFSTSSQSAMKWFDVWYNHQPNTLKFGYKHYTTLLYPTYVFDHCRGFAQATRYLVYHNTGGRIPDHQPRDFMSSSPANATSLQMPPYIMQQVNAARARLKTILHRALYTPIDRLIKEACCNCAPSVLYNYESSLAQTGVWPLESKLMSDSILNALHDLKNYDGPQWQIQTCGSQPCTFDFESTVSIAKGEISDYFSGLCLDCMKASVSDDVDSTYWTHSTPGVSWNQGCRIEHGQPSWYFSFMGPREDMMEWVKAPKSKPIKDRKDHIGDHHNHVRADQSHQAHGDQQQPPFDGRQQYVGTYPQDAGQTQPSTLPQNPYQRQQYHQPQQYFGRRGRGYNSYRRDRSTRGNGSGNTFAGRSRYGKRRGSGRGLGVVGDVRLETNTGGDTGGDTGGVTDGAAASATRVDTPADIASAPGKVTMPAIQVELAELNIGGNEKKAAA